MAKKRKTKLSGKCTDDSGVVISLKQYAELHGEPGTSNRMHLLGAKLFQPKPRNIFAEIAQMDESAGKTTKQKVKMLECEYCHAIFRWDAIGLHTIKTHRTKDLRFKPAGEIETVVKRKTRHKNKQPCPEKDSQDVMENIKGTDYYRRESNGQFGSFPLHDDYSDESDA